MLCHATRVCGRHNQSGKYPPPRGAPLTLGLEVSGRVVATGPLSHEASDETAPTLDSFKEGDRVCALVAGGG
jgi:NADPH2:quinone reductase